LIADPIIYNTRNVSVMKSAPNTTFPISSFPPVPPMKPTSFDSSQLDLSIGA
ncbi:unnamed protein product, partial [Rotaria sp. Silwood2]